ncbi:MAG: Rieske 2Fe-2S domain-containing protein [Micropepsaceae bacterium]
MTRLCTVSDLARTGAKGITLADGREIVVVESSSGPRAFLNSCPHNGTTLEILPDRFFDAERQLLVCTTHGARFLPASGLCVSGPCTGRHLTPISIRLDGNDVILDV